jgi:hypothetical protein
MVGHVTIDNYTVSMVIDFRAQIGKSRAKPRESSAC